MAEETVGAILIGLQVGEGIEKAQAIKDKEKATEDAIRARETEERIAGNEKTIARDRQIQSTVGHQIAIEAASGFELDSPTFESITMDDFNKFAETRSNDALELDIKENQLQQDSLQNKLQAKAQIFGDVLSTAASIINPSGLFTNISSQTLNTRTKLASPLEQNSFDEARKKALERRKSSGGLFDTGDN